MRVINLIHRKEIVLIDCIYRMQRSKTGRINQILISISKILMGNIYLKDCVKRVLNIVL